MSGSAAGLPSPAFARWWFESAAAGAPDERRGPPRAAGLLAQRMWPRARQLEALPADPDWRWAAAAPAAPAQLVRAATLFDAMACAQWPPCAARERDAMEAEDRRWALSVAAIQPFARQLPWPASTVWPAPQRGLLEIRPRMEAAFPGLWARLAGSCDWPDTLRPAAAPAAAAPEPEASARRAGRAWALCMARVLGPGNDPGKPEP